jgi:hypothetical protein
MKTDIRPFKAEDMLHLLETGIKEFGLKCIPTDQMKELAQEREDNGQCITGFYDDEIVGCGGIDLMWPGVGEVWLFLSYEVDRYPKQCFRVIKNGLDKLIEDNELIRCQAWCRSGFDKGHTLFRHLGFKPEGIAEKYMPDGTDAILYAKVKNV